MISLAPTSQGMDVEGNEEDDDDEADSMEVESLLLSNLSTFAESPSKRLPPPPPAPLPLVIKLPPIPPTLPSSALITPCTNNPPKPKRVSKHFSSPSSSSLSSASSSSSVPRSILKRSLYPILRAPSVVEGSRRNSGRRKHFLGWGDVIAVLEGVVVDAKSVGKIQQDKVVESTADRKGGEGGGSMGGAKGKSGGSPSKDSKEARGEGRRLNRNRPAGGAGGGISGSGSGGSGGRGPPTGTNVPTSLSTARQLARDTEDDEDPQLFLAPLLILKASLRPACSSSAGPTTPGKARGGSTSSPSVTEVFFPRPFPDDTDDSPMELDGDTRSTPPTLPEIEAAYLLLIRAFIRLPSNLSSLETTLAPLYEHKSTLKRCLERELANVVSFPTFVATFSARGEQEVARRDDLPSSSPVSTESSSPSLQPQPHSVKGAAGASGKGKEKEKVGLSQELMCRQKDEVGAAIAGIKCFAAVAKDERLSSVFSELELNSLLGRLLAIPGAPDLSSAILKDVYPFVAWFLHTQRLPTSIISPFLLRILGVIKLTLVTLDKPRNNFSEATSALTRFLETHPEAVVQEWKGWFKVVVDGLWEGVKKGMGVRYRVIQCLGAFARVLREEAGGDEQVKAKRAEVSDRVAEYFIDLLSRKEPRPSERAKRDQQDTVLVSLTEQLQSVLKTEDALWTVEVLAVIPALLGSRFRKLEPRGIRPWLVTVNRCRDHSSFHIRMLSTLLWTHLTYGFLSARADDGSLWVLRTEGKPWSLLLQVFQGNKAQAETCWDVSATTTEGATPAVENAVYARVLSSLVAGLTHLNRGISSAYKTPWLLSDSAPLGPVDRQLDNLDFVWDKVVAAELGLMLEHSKPTGSLSTDYAAAFSRDTFAWNVLHAIVADPALTKPVPSLETLINPVLLEGNVLKLRDHKSDATTHFETFVARCVDAVPHTSSIAGWPARWLVSRSTRVLSMFEKVVGISQGAVGTVSAEAFSNGSAFWAKYLEAFGVETDEDIKHVAMADIYSWLIQRRQVLGDLGSAMIRSVLEDFGDLLLDLSALPECRNLAADLIASLFDHRTASSQCSEAFVTSVDCSLRLLAQLSPIETALQAVTISISSCDVTGDRFDPTFESLVSLWDRLLSRRADVDFTVVKPLVELLAFHTRRVDSAASGSSLIRRLALVIFSSELVTASFTDYLVASSEPVQNAGVIQSFLLSIGAHVEEAICARLIQATNVTLSALHDNAPEAFVEVTQDLLNVLPPSTFPAIYIHMLSLLADIEPSASELARVSKLLETLFPHFSGLVTSQDREADVVANVLQAVLAFHTFWSQTFKAAADDVQFSQPLADLLSIIRKASADNLAPNLGETQFSLPAPTGSASSALQLSLSLPNPAQVAPSVPRPTLHDSTASGPVSGEGYEPGTSNELLLASTSTFAPPVRMGSPSLELPASQGDVGISPASAPENRRRSLRSAGSSSSVAAPLPIPRKASGKRKRASGSVSSSEIVPETQSANGDQLESDAEEVVVVTNSRPHKKAKSAAPARPSSLVSNDTEPRFRPYVEVKPHEASSAAPSTSNNLKKKRAAVPEPALEQQESKRARLNWAEASDTGNFSDVVIPETSSDGSQPSSPIPSADASATHHLLATSYESMVKATRRIGGTAGIQHLVELGKYAATFLTKSPTKSSASSSSASPSP